jgi:hypothetical protein
MPYLIEPLYDRTFEETLSYLETAHDFVVVRAEDSLRPLGKTNPWGTVLKRRLVTLAGEDRPAAVGKSKETLSEVINIIATVERLSAGIRWLSVNFSNAKVSECHPSTSDTSGGSDLVLKLSNGTEVARAEASDVVSETQDSNAKEVSDLERLGCAITFPDDDTRRFLITSSEFGRYLTRPRRRWATKHYGYIIHEAGDRAGTLLLEVVRGPHNPGLNRTAPLRGAYG